MPRTALVALALVAAPGFALADDHVQPTGDAAAGERAFRQCIACHVVVDDSGETLAGRNARTGPNLWQVPGRPAASVADFDYSESLAAAGEQDLVWTEAAFVAYVQDPTSYLRDYLGDDRARGAMSYRVRSEDDALNVYAYLASLGTFPAADGDGDTAAASE